MRGWYVEWGASDVEVYGEMVGDDWVPEPNYQMTLGVTIAARPSDIWPWLVQMGLAAADSTAKTGSIDCWET